MSMDLIVQILIEAGTATAPPGPTPSSSSPSHSFLHSLPPDHTLASILTPLILSTTGDNSLALSTSFKSLSIAVQLSGLDSQDAAHHHGQVAALLADVGK